jgi:hypothetical protein
MDILQITLHGVAGCKLPALKTIASHLKLHSSGNKGVIHDRIVLELTVRKDSASFRSECAAILLICGLPVTFPLTSPPPEAPKAVTTLPPVKLSTPVLGLPVVWNPWAPGFSTGSASNRRGCPCGSSHAPSTAVFSPPTVKCASPGCATKYHVNCIGLPLSEASVSTWRCAVCRAAGMMPFAELLQVLDAPRLLLPDSLVPLRFNMGSIHLREPANPPHNVSVRIVSPGGPFALKILPRALALLPCFSPFFSALHGCV